MLIVELNTKFHVGSGTNIDITIFSFGSDVNIPFSISIDTLDDFELSSTLHEFGL